MLQTIVKWIFGPNLTNDVLNSGVVSFSNNNLCFHNRKVIPSIDWFLYVLTPLSSRVEFSWRPIIIGGGSRSADREPYVLGRNPLITIKSSSHIWQPCGLKYSLILNRVYDVLFSHFYATQINGIQTILLFKSLRIFMKSKKNVLTPFK